jgi:hypothetical protein
VWHGRPSFKDGVYSNPGGNFSIKFPSSWSERPANGKIAFAAGLSSVELCLVFFRSADGVEAIKAGLNAAASRFLASNSEKNGLQEFDLNGTTAYRIEGTSTVGLEVKTVLVGANVGKSFVVLQCSAPPKRFDEMQNDFNDVISSMRSL